MQLMTPYKRLALSLGKIFTDPDLVKQAKTFVMRHPDRESWYWFIRYATYQKVIPQMYQNAVALQAAGVEALGNFLLENLQEQYELRCYQRKTFFPRAVAWLHELFEQYGINYLFFKGVQFAEFYPEDFFRQSNDIDILVPDLDTFFETVNCLTNAGFRIDYVETPWIARPQFREEPKIPVKQNSFLLAHIAMAIDKWDAELKVDIHVQNMSINDLGDPVSGKIWERAVEQRPSYEDAILILTAHSITHGMFTQKDVNDLYLLLKSQSSNINWEYVLPHIDRSGLGPALRYVLLKCQSTYPEQLVPASVLKALHYRPVINLMIRTADWLGTTNFWLMAQPLAQIPITYLAYRPLGTRSAWKRVRDMLQLTLAHYLPGKLYEYDFLQNRLVQSVEEVTLLDFQTGQRVNLVDAGELVDEDNGRSNTTLATVEALQPFIEKENYRLHKLAQHAHIVEKDGAEVLMLPGNFLIPTNSGIFYEEDLENIQRLYTYANASQNGVSTKAR